MTVRTPPSFLQNITLVSAGHTAQNDRLTQGALWTPGAGGGSPLSNRTGIAPAPVGGNGEVSVLSNTLVRVKPFRALIQGTRSTLQGQYTVINDADVDLAVDAQAAGVSRIDTLMVNVCDSAFSPDTLDTARLIVVKGTPAASNPQAPTLGGANLGNQCILGYINVPATGGTVTFTPYAGGSVRPAGGVVALGGVRPVAAIGETTPGAYIGEYRDSDDGYSLQRWNGTKWKSVSGGTYSATPSSQQIDPGGVFGIQVGAGEAPAIGVRGFVLVSIGFRVLNGASQQTVQISGHPTASTGITYGQTDMETADRIPGAPSSGEVIWRMYRHIEIIPTALNWTLAVQIVVGTGGTSVQITNPRSMVLWSPYV